MKKVFVLLLALALVMGCTACAQEELLGDGVSYPVDGPVHSLDIRINAANLTVEESDAFSVYSNLKNLSVAVEDGTLCIIENTKAVSVTYTDAELTLCVPAGTVFDTLRISTGAAKLTADNLSAHTAELRLGAGDVYIGRLSADTAADIEGGAGRITVADGTLQDLDLEMGVGALRLTAALTGRSELTFGVGDADVTLLGKREDYTLDLEKGIGGITVEAGEGSAPGASASRHVEISGGLGNIDITFKEH